MPARKNPKTAFGLELLQFCARNGITYKQVAAAADVKHSTLVECTTGRCAGHELIPKVRRYMEDYFQAPRPRQLREPTAHLERAHLLPARRRLCHARELQAR